jgi:hypothetical protein
LNGIPVSWLLGRPNLTKQLYKKKWPN